MEIRKIFSFELSRLVNKNSIDKSFVFKNNNVIIEAFIKINCLNDLMESPRYDITSRFLEEFFSSLDKSVILSSSDDQDYISSVQDRNDKWVIVPVKLTREALSIYFCALVNFIISKARIGKEAEEDIHCSRLIYGEGQGEMVEVTREDTGMIVNHLGITEFSDSVLSSLSKDLNDLLFGEGVNRE